MIKVKKRWVISLAVVAVLAISYLYLSSVNIPVLEPKGIIADKEFRLLLLVTGIMLIIVIPVFVLLFYILYMYRDSNTKKTKYSPDWDHSRIIEGIWWTVPSLMILVLSIITWRATYALNPYRPIASKKPPIVVQVVSLQWKWLFIYPKENVASVNRLVIPVNTPIHFYLTSDAPMNSFWVPQLSGQIYSMPGMRTQLYIMANQKGVYNGWSANISGAGFAGMMFQAQATSSANYSSWINKIRTSSPVLTLSTYNKLSKPSSYVKPKYYSYPSANLFNGIILKYRIPNFSYRKLA